MLSWCKSSGVTETPGKLSWPRRATIKDDTARRIRIFNTCFFLQRDRHSGTSIISKSSQSIEFIWIQCIKTSSWVPLNSGQQAVKSGPWEGLAYDLLSTPSSPKVKIHPSFCRARFGCRPPEIHHRAENDSKWFKNIKRNSIKLKVQALTLEVCLNFRVADLGCQGDFASKLHVLSWACPTFCRDTWPRSRFCNLYNLSSHQCNIVQLSRQHTIVQVVPLVSKLPCFMRISCVSRKTCHRAIDSSTLWHCGHDLGYFQLAHWSSPSDGCTSFTRLHLAHILPHCIPIGHGCIRKLIFLKLIFGN